MAGDSVDHTDFRAVFRALPGRFALFSRDFRILEISAALCAALQRPREAFVGRIVFDCFPPDPSDPDNRAMTNLEASLRHVIAARVPDLMDVQRYDVRLPEAQGGGLVETYWSPVNTPLFGADGEVACIIHRSEDVTELISALDKGDRIGAIADDQAALIQQLRDRNDALARQVAENQRLGVERASALDEKLSSDRRFRDLADSLPGVVHQSLARADGTRKNIYVSAGVERYLGVPAEEFMEGRAYLADFMHPDDREVRQAALQVAQDRNETAEIDLRMLPKTSATPRWWRLRTTPTPLANGDVRWDGFAIDITDRKAAEHELLQARKLDAIGQLTGGIAHDFNNLLSVILSNAEVLAEELADDPALRPLAEMTQQAAQRGAELTNSLLAFARRQPLEPRAVKIDRLIRGMERLLRRTLGDEIDIEFVHPAALWQANADPAQLEAAVLNLALNARDAMPEGGRLTIETENVRLDEEYAAAHAEVEPGAYVMICVTDTGSGMTPEVAARAFEPFFTTKEQGRGAGLGLAMVYGFVKQSKGHVKIYSEPGHGTALKIYLPRSASAAVEDDVVAPARALRGAETVLLVEDDPLVRANAETMLKSLGYKVLVADRATSALPIVESGTAFDLLFTDVIMPGGMTGKDLADRVSMLRPGVKILFTSGYTENSIVHHGRLDPGVNLIRKPYGRRALAEKVRQVLETEQKNR